MSGSRGYRIRSYTNGKSKEGKEYKNYALTVPNDIAEALPAGIQFRPRMTDEGLLYEPVERAVINLPAWAKEQKSPNGKAESKEKRARAASG